MANLHVVINLLLNNIYIFDVATLFYAQELLKKCLI